MKFDVLGGLYRDYPTHWYYGHDEKGDVCASTRKRDLPRVDGDVWLSHDERVILCYCPKCERAMSTRAVTQSFTSKQPRRLETARSTKISASCSEVSENSRGSIYKGKTR